MATGGPIRRGRGARAGFSLVELMVAVGILTVVVAAVMQSFVVQNQTYTVVDQTIEAQQNMRAVAWILERDVRLSGFLVPEAAALCAVDATNAADMLWLTDADAVDPTDQVRSALGANVTNYTNGVSQLTVDNTTTLDGDPFYDTDDDGNPDADFQIGGGVIVVDVDDPTRGVACGIVDDVLVNRIDVDFQARMRNNPPGTNRVIAVPAHVYAVVNDPVNGEPMLTRNGLPLALDVEDLQAAFFFDDDRDGVMDDPADEHPGSEAARQNGVTYDTDGSFDNRELREVRINLVVRTREAEREYQAGMFQATENRAPVAIGDGFRRRVHTSTVRLRNVGYRGVAL